MEALQVERERRLNDAENEARMLEKQLNEVVSLQQKSEENHSKEISSWRETMDEKLQENQSLFKRITDIQEELLNSKEANENSAQEIESLTDLMNEKEVE